jgi:hypothetical protein
VVPRERVGVQVRRAVGHDGDQGRRPGRAARVREAPLFGPRVGPPGYQAAHAVGAGMGVESPHGIAFATEKVNQELQNREIERQIRVSTSRSGRTWTCTCGPRPPRRPAAWTWSGPLTNCTPRRATAPCPAHVWNDRVFRSSREPADGSDGGLPRGRPDRRHPGARSRQAENLTARPHPEDHLVAR